MKPKPRSEKEITASIRALLEAFRIFHYQRMFLKIVKMAGGIAIVARSVEDVALHLG